MSNYHPTYTADLVSVMTEVEVEQGLAAIEVGGSAASYGIAAKKEMLVRYGIQRQSGNKKKPLRSCKQQRCSHVSYIENQKQVQTAK